MKLNGLYNLEKKVTRLSRLGFKKISQYTACTLSVLTMVSSPVAMGFESEKLTRSQIETALIQLSLNKPITAGEFYSLNKELFPERIRVQIEPMILQNPNIMMPSFEVVTAKNSQGEDVPTINVTQGKEFFRIEVLGQEDKFFKFQNTNLSIVDIINFSDMYNRIIAGNESIRKNLEKAIESNKGNSKNSNSDNSSISFNESIQSGLEGSVDSGYPAVSADIWKKMSQQQRAEYFLNSRLLWNDARKVLIEAEKLQSDKLKKKSKTSATDSTKARDFSSLLKWDSIAAVAFQNVEAAADRTTKGAQVEDRKSTGKKGKDPVRKATVRRQNPPPPVVEDEENLDDVNLNTGTLTNPPIMGSNLASSAGNCIIAGYISSYRKNGSCSTDGIFKNYPNQDLIIKANQFCKNSNNGGGSNSIACSPYVYGTPNGTPTCVDTKKVEIQNATHFEGKCDSASRLGSKIDFLNNPDLMTKKRYNVENLKLNDKGIDEAVLNEQLANPDYVKNYISGLIKFRSDGKNSINFGNALSDSDLQIILETQNAFNTDIKNATQSCKMATETNTNNEPNFWGACDQLQRRRLFVAQFLAKTPGCKEGSKIDVNTLKCQCKDVSGRLTKAVNPGASCSASSPVPTPVVLPGAGVKECDINNITDPNCKCPGSGQKPIVQSTSNSGAQVLECKSAETKTAIKNTKKAEEKCDDDYWCETKKIATKLIPSVPTALQIIAYFALGKALWKQIMPQKPKLNPAADLCPNGAPAPCTQACTENKYHVRLPPDNNCGCPLCGVGQSITVAATCTCGSGAPATTTGPVKCPDGTTAPTLSGCPPVMRYRCPDGATMVYNLLNCTEQPKANKAAPTGGTSK